MKSDSEKLVCKVCSSNYFFLYDYANHVRKFKPIFIKHYILFYMLEILKIVGIKLPVLEARILFFPKFKIQVCYDCGYGWYMKPLTKEQLKKYYESSYWHSHKNISFDQDAFKINKRAIQQFDFVKSFVVNAKKILEIGSAEAFFTQYYKFKNPHVDSHIVESGLNWQKYHQESNIRIVADYFPCKLNKAYDYIHTSHWLEHVLDLEETLTCFHHCLSDSGLVFVEVPNCDRSYWKKDMGDIPHIHFFSLKSLIMLFESNQFKALKTDIIDSNQEGIRALFQKLS